MRFSKWLARGLAASALSLAACSGAEAGPASPAAQPANQDVAGLSHLGLLRNALDKVALRPDQKAEVERLLAATRARHEPIRAAHTALREKLSEQVVAGKIDRAALEPQVAAILDAVDMSRPDDRAAIVRLHDLMDKGQREQLAFAVESAFRAGMHDRQGHGPRQWAADLRLSDQQREQIRAAMRDRFHRDGEGAREHWRAAHEQGRRLLQSFREDKLTLDGTTVLGREQMQRGIDRMIDLADVAVPILRPEQRALAAQKIRTEPVRH